MSTSTLSKVNLKGKFYPALGTTNTLIQVPGEGTFLVVFSNIRQMSEIMSRAHLVYDNYNEIVDEKGFLEALPLNTSDGKRIRIMVDPRVVDGNQLQFEEVFRTDVA